MYQILAATGTDEERALEQAEVALDLPRNADELDADLSVSRRASGRPRAKPCSAA